MKRRIIATRKRAGRRPPSLRLWSISLLVAIAFTACKDDQGSGAKISGSTSKDDDSNTSRDDGKLGQQDIGPVSYVDSPLADTFIKLVEEISARAPMLNRERDRRGKLRLALGSQLGEGCMQDVKVKNIEVVIEGQKLGEADASAKFKGKDLPPGEASQSIFEFSFGDSTFAEALTFSNDESQNALFGVAARKIWMPERDDFTIGKIQRIKIRKLNASFKVQSLCAGGGVLSACEMQTRVWETERFYLASLKIKINGELIFDKGNIGHMFASFAADAEDNKSLGLGWSDDHMDLNEAYVKMKQKDDCSAIQ